MAHEDETETNVSFPCHVVVSSSPHHVLFILILPCDAVASCSALAEQASSFPPSLPLRRCRRYLPQPPTSSPQVWRGLKRPMFVRTKSRFGFRVEEDGYQRVALFLVSRQ